MATTCLHYECHESENLTCSGWRLTTRHNVSNLNCVLTGPLQQRFSPKLMRWTSSESNLQVSYYYRAVYRRLKDKFILKNHGRLFMWLWNKFVQTSMGHFLIHFRKNSDLEISVRASDQGRSWQLISANLNRWNFAHVEPIAQRLLRFQFAPVDLSLIFEQQETRSWDVENFQLVRFVFMLQQTWVLHFGCVR